MINEPQVLFADEPTGNLDSDAAAETMVLLAETHAQGQTLVLATHDRRVASAADRVLRLRDGGVASRLRQVSKRRPTRKAGWRS